MAGLLQNVTLVVEEAVDWIGEFVGLITAPGNEILLLGIIISFVGLGVGLIKRLMRI